MHKYTQIYANICKYMHLPHEFTSIAYMQKYAKNMHVYAKYVSMKLYA